jgi:hypothetical protein
VNNIRNVSGRGFLKLGVAAGTFVLASRVLPEPLWAEETAVFNPDMFLAIASDGRITIIASRSSRARLFSVWTRSCSGWSTPRSSIRRC